MSDRKKFSKRTRFEIFKRDGFTCQYCGAHPPGVLLHLDHIVALAAGGADDEDNLITACEPCNLGKGARDLRIAPQSIEAKALETEEREAQLLGWQQILEAKRQRLDDETWRVLEELFGQVKSVPRDAYASTKRFIEKLGVHETLDAAEVAMSAAVHRRNRFRYFCGVCWNKVREQER